MTTNIKLVQYYLIKGYRHPSLQKIDPDLDPNKHVGVLINAANMFTA